MRLTMTIGALSLDLRWGDTDNGKDPGDCTTTPVGFTPSPGDQRWERGTDV